MLAVHSHLRTALALALLAALGLHGVTSADQGVPAPGDGAYPSKPARAVIDARFQKEYIQVRFTKATPIRFRNGQLSDLGTGSLGDVRVQNAMANLAGGRWERVHKLDEAQIDQLVIRAELNTRESMPDLNNAYFYWLPQGMDAAAAVDILNSLPIVEMAEGVPIVAEDPVPPSFQTEQKYHYPRRDRGAGAFAARLIPGSDGARVRVADVERGFNPAHLDLPGISMLGGQLRPASVDHGTAVLGQLFGLNNSFGVVGGVYEATPYFSSYWFGSDNSENVAAGISNCLGIFGPGDVILIEAQLRGPAPIAGCCSANPNCDVSCVDQFGMIAVEWNRTVYDTIRVAVGNGVHVVEAAGNGSQNLNSPIYSQGNGGHYPFTNPALDSGAIIVGAGGSGQPGWNPDRQRLSFSNFGTRVNLQGWGEAITTCGYGMRYNSEGTNLLYTNQFGGTSGASPIVTSVVAAFNSILEEHGTIPSPAYTRQVLTLFGQPQTGNTNENIGPRPDLLAAVEYALATPENFSCLTPTTVSPHSIAYGFPIVGRLVGFAPAWYRVALPNYPVTLAISTCGTSDFGGVDTGIDTLIHADSACFFGVDLGTNNNRPCGGDAGNNTDSTHYTSSLPDQTEMLFYIQEATFGQAGPFRFTVSMAAQNDSCGGARVITQNGVYYGSLTGLAAEGNASCVNNSQSPDAWFSYTPCGNGRLLVTTCGTNDTGGIDRGMDTVLSAFTSCGGPEIACSDDFYGNQYTTCGNSDQGAIRDSALLFNVVAGQTYMVRIANYPGTPAANYEIRFIYTPDNDYCGYPELLTAITQGTTTFDSTCATGPASDYTCNSITSVFAHDLYFRYTPTSTGPVTIDTCGSSFDTQLGIYEACPYETLFTIACDDDSCGAQSRLTVNLTAGTEYLVRVGGANQNAYGAGVIRIGSGCRADFNHDGMVTSQDFFDFLTAFFGIQAAADVNNDGIVNSQDFFDFIGAFFNGCN